MKSVKINGVDYTNDSILDYSIKYERTEDDVTSVKFNDKITFTGKAFNFINFVYFEELNIKQVLEVEIEGCCDTVIKLEIGYRNVTKINDCTIEATPVSKIESQYDDLKKTIWFSNNFDTDNENYRQHYCTGFTFIMYVLVFLYYLLIPIVSALKAIEWLTGWDLGIDDFERAVHGCGRYHIAYSIREVMEYQANKLGLKFQSTILQESIYKTLLFLPAQNDKGFVSDEEHNFNKPNAPFYSVLALGKLFEPIFNAKIWLENGVLRFERKDTYEQLTSYLIDVDDEGIEVEYSFKPSEGWAYGRFQYATDQMDQDCNEMANAFNDVVEFNSPPEDWQKGERDITLRDFSVASFQRDLSQPSVIDELRDLIANRKNDLVLSNGLTAQMKLLLYNPDEKGKKDIRVYREPEPDFNGDTAYNLALRFDSNQDSNELYKTFYKIDDPRTYVYIEGKGFDYVPLDFCTFANEIDKYGTRIGIKSKYGIGQPESIELDLERGVAKIGKITWRLPLV